MSIFCFRFRGQKMDPVRPPIPLFLQEKHTFGRQFRAQKMDPKLATILCLGRWFFRHPTGKKSGRRAARGQVGHVGQIGTQAGQVGQVRQVGQVGRISNNEFELRVQSIESRLCCGARGRLA